MASKRYPLNQSPLYKLITRRRLAALLYMSEPALRKAANNASQTYKEWDAVTASGKLRHIETPNPSLRRIHSRIATLLNAIEAPDYLMCPVKGRSYVTNAAVHKGAAHISTLDISNFFPSVTEEHVRNFFFHVMKCSIDVARVLAQLSTRNGYLPTGSPLSPIVAFYAFYDLWGRINTLCQEAGRLFTLYVDDITVSGAGKSPKLIYQIKREVRLAGLEVKASKERHFFKGHGPVTGVYIGHSSLSAPKASHLKLSNLRQEYAHEKDADIRAHLKQRVRGIEAQHAQIRQANILPPMK